MRALVVGNGSMLVGLDKHGMVHDFYYPYVGLENHATARLMHHKIGIFVGGKFSWLDDGNWDIKINYEPDAMAGMTTAVNSKLGVSLEFHDFVDAEYNVFCRNIHVINNHSNDRTIKLFMHQVFKISESNRGDTALFVPDGNYILDYKGKRSFLIYGEQANGDSFDQYSIGIHGIEGKEGTFADAEDGELSGHPVEHGTVDSTIRFSVDLPSNSSKRIHYWIAAAASHGDVEKIHKEFLGSGFNSRYERTQQYWQEWLKKSDDFGKKLDDKYISLFRKSLFIMKSHMDKRGSILASGDSELLNYARDNYSYCWPRDAAFVLQPLIRMGYKEEARAFFEFARDVLTEDGSLKHKFQPDRAVGSTWHPLVHKHQPELAIQEDETAIVLYLLKLYMDEIDDEDFVRRFYGTLVQPAANFLETFIDQETRLPHASYDLWEEKFLTNTYTVAITVAGLRAAAAMAEQFEYPDDAIRWQTVADEMQIEAQKILFNSEKGYFYKGFLLQQDGSLSFDDTIDVSSLYGAAIFELFSKDSDEVKTSLATIDKELNNISPSQGIARYEYDQYCKSPEPYKGNPWAVTTLWMGQIYSYLGDKDKVGPALDWAQKNSLKSGVISEQVDPVTSEFRSVAPLIWSQAEFVNTLLDTLE